jgi:membrane protein DedA with SNARE-associated domain
MIANILSLLTSFVVSVISRFGYPGLFLLMTLENIFPPLPSEIILPFAGYLAYTGHFNLWWVATVGAVGCNVGSGIVYWFAAIGARPFLVRHGKYMLISHREIDTADRWFAKYGHWAVFFSRLLPLVRSLIALPAGVARMSLWKFHLYTFLGSWIWCFLLAYAGYVLGEHWPALRTYFERFDNVIAVLLALAAIAYVWIQLKRLRQERRAATAGSRTELVPPEGSKSP